MEICRALTWKDGFYNGETKTRRITNSSLELTSNQLVMQRREQLRELYESLLSGKCDHRAARPLISLSPEDLADAEWYYLVCMTYTFRPWQGYLITHATQLYYSIITVNPKHAVIRLPCNIILLSVISTT